MELEELETLLANKIFSREVMKRYQEIEKELINNEEVRRLSKEMNQALDAYNEVLRWYQSTSPICEEKKKILHEKKLALDSHPLVQEYLKVYNEANEPFVYLERNLLSRFRRKKKIC